MPSSKWRSERNGADWLMDEKGRLIGYRDETGKEHALVTTPKPRGFGEDDEPDVRDVTFPSVCDSDGRCIGMVGNLYETLGDAGQIAPAVLPLAPTPVPPATTLDCGAYWYQDFGLEYTRVNVPGSMVWYDNRWNQMGRAGANFYPDRYPALGWYRGDSAIIQSWQVKWMLEAGCTWAVLQQRTNTIDTANWATPSNIAHWLYQLYTNVPAVVSGAFKTALWVPQSDTAGASALAPTNGNWSSGPTYLTGQTTVNTAFDNRLYVALRDNQNKRPDQNALDWQVVSMPATWTALVAFYAARPGTVKTIQRKGKAYPVVYFHEGEVCRSTWGSGTWRIWLQELGAALNAANPAWEGVAVLVRNSPAPTVADTIPGTGTINYDLAETNRAVILRTDYNGSDASSGAAPTYDGLINAFPAFSSIARGEARQRRVFAVPTSLKSVPPHPSTFPYAGHSPAKFKAFVLKVRKEIEAGRGFPLVMINNVSEWAESGPGLQPNLQDGFGYLKALREALTE